MFIGRKEELAFFEERYEAETAQFIVLYGRRRVGKTETLKYFCQEKQHVFYSCTECTDEQQLQSFSDRILRTGIPAAQYITGFSSWEQAFRSILDIPGQGKKILVIDEFPYMVKNNHSIPSILQRLWDEIFKDNNIMIILCGSSMSFMEKEILAEKNPLYGRATGILKMKEMGFYDAVQFVPKFSIEEKVAAYAILGGIPHYLKQFSDELTLEENLKRNILLRGSILYSEVEFLMRQELRETTIYNTIITAVALGSTKLNEIHQKTQIEKTKLSVYLKNLIDLGILSREFPVTDRIKEQANAQRGLYKITDNFFKFWYAYVFPNLSELEAGDVEGIWKYVISPDIDNYVSYVFEDVCIQYLRKQNCQNKLPFHFTKIGRWWNKTDELDILALDRTGEHILIGECKYKNVPFPLSEVKKMEQKFQPVNQNTKIKYYIFSKNGFTEDTMRYAEEKGISAIDLKEVCG